MKFENIVWTAVIALAMGLGSLFSAYAGDLVYTLAFGFCSVSSALLSARERR